MLMIIHIQVFYITPSVEPSLKVVKNLVESAGGRVENRRLKTTSQIREFNKVCLSKDLIFRGFLRGGVGD